MDRTSFEPNPEYTNENYSPTIPHALRWSGKIKYQQMDDLKQEMKDYINAHEAQETGQFIVFVRESKVGMGRITAEVILPIDREVPARTARSARRFQCVEDYLMKGCIMSKYQGFFLPPQSEYHELIIEAMDLLCRYEQENGIS